MQLDHLPGRDPGAGLLVDANGVLFSCPEGLVGAAAGLPVIAIESRVAEKPVAGGLCELQELHRGLAMLRLAGETAGMSDVGVAEIRQMNAWSVRLTTGAGVQATFGLSDHARQFDDLVVAIDHAGGRGYEIATIDLIPERNIPITLSSPPPPRAIPVRPSEAAPAPDSRSRDLKALLNRS